MPKKQLTPIDTGPELVLPDSPASELRKETMKIQLSKNQALSIASLSVATDPKQFGNAAVLGEVDVTIKDGKITALATDRFMAVRYTDTIESPDAEFRLTNALAKFILTNVKAKYSGTVDLTVDGYRVTVSLDFGMKELSESFTSYKYPGIEQIIDSWSASDAAHAVALKIQFLARLEKLRLDGEFADLWHFELGKDVNRPNRPGPVMATAAKDPERLTAIVQPNLLVKAGA